jgi:membrane protein
MQKVRKRRHSDGRAGIAARGWSAMKAIYQRVSNHRVLALAAGSAFYAVLALSPALAAGVSVYGLFADAKRIASLVGELSSVLPDAVTAVLRDQLQRLAEQPRSTLGLTLAASLALSLWSANRGTKAIIDALNIVYGVSERRGFVRLHLVSLAMTAGTVLVAVLAVAATVVVPLAMAYIGFDAVLAVARWPLLYIVVTAGLAALYFLAPHRASPDWRWVIVGSAVASTLWLVSSLLFSWYAGNFAHYNKTYGSLGGIVALLMWLWLSTVVVLLGAEIDAEMEQRSQGQAPSQPSSFPDAVEQRAVHGGQLPPSTSH